MERPSKEMILRTLENESTPKEAKKVFRWLSSPEGQCELSQLIDEDYPELSNNKDSFYIDHPIPSKKIHKYISLEIRKRKYKLWAFRIAALLIPFVLIMMLYQRINTQVNVFSKSQYDEVFVPKGEKMQIIFQDGSKAYLNADTHIKYPKKFGLKERTISLEGEAYFQIAKNKNRPFYINLSNLQIRVLGTSFNVKSYPKENEIIVSLESGSIQIKNDIIKSIKLAPGEKAIYKKDSGKCYHYKPSPNITDFSEWRNNKLILKDTPLIDVLNTLSHKYNIDYTITNKDACKYSYTLQTKFTSLNTILKELEKIAPVKFENKENKIIVTIK